MEINFPPSIFVAQFTDRLLHLKRISAKKTVTKWQRQKRENSLPSPAILVSPLLRPPPSLTFNDFLNFCQKVPELSPLKKSHFCVAPFYFPLFAKKSGLHFLFLPAVGFLTGFNTAAASMRLPPSSIATVC